jgi:Spy/CpxP family protein refolding chaperone
MLNKIIFMFSLLLTTGIMAQDGPPGPPDPEREEKIKVLKRAFITEKLDLTVSEAEKFWPLYNEHEKNRKAFREEMHKLREEEKKITDKNALKEHIRKMTEVRKREADADQNFLLSCVDVLRPEQVKKLVRVEEEFRKKLLDKLRERRGDRGNPPPGGRGPGRRE